MPSTSWSLKPTRDLLPKQFEAWQTLLENRTGMVLDERRRSFLLTQLNARMRELGLDNYDEYLARVGEGPQGAVEWARLLDRLTVQETRFFRHPASFNLLDEYLQERVRQGLQRPLQMWSAGCSTGDEMYSLAICAAQALGEDEKQWSQFGVTGTDISAQALRTASQGVYAAARLNNVSQAQRERFFTPAEDGRYAVIDALKSRCCNIRLNVLELNNAPLHSMDVIFCQNLLIYFRRWRRRDILNRLIERLAPGGIMVIGVGEVTGWQHPDAVPVADEHVLAFMRRNGA
ncbi:type IV pilus assembly protein PilK [Atopomonas hussainii]|uniref:protein-glutamate O-methyltransferase n=1 Tax=Atopomonas hussainii TaxID=1429083 RepID=A0A1H7I7N9_9GAMM|nr:CheR family methyltransferase [Atopomonas hussainii]SEK57767.1 type IV pilus assembly protein PilK [Atopomonas hussainii]